MVETPGTAPGSSMVMSLAFIAIAGVTGTDPIVADGDPVVKV
jgi:hypothetical protein